MVCWAVMLFGSFTVCHWASCQRKSLFIFILHQKPLLHTFPYRKTYTFLFFHAFTEKKLFFSLSKIKQEWKWSTLLFMSPFTFTCLSVFVSSSYKYVGRFFSPIASHAFTWQMILFLTFFFSKKISNQSQKIPGSCLVVLSILPGIITLTIMMITFGNRFYTLTIFWHTITLRCFFEKIKSSWCRRHCRCNNNRYRGHEDGISKRSNGSIELSSSSHGWWLGHDDDEDNGVLVVGFAVYSMAWLDSSCLLSLCSKVKATAGRRHGHGLKR